jgi:DNA-binding NtrC family response regulator
MQRDSGSSSAGEGRSTFGREIAKPERSADESGRRERASKRRPSAERPQFRAIYLDASITGYHEQIRELKRQVIRDALKEAGGVQSLAAEQLGIQRSYLSRLMKNLNMR